MQLANVALDDKYELESGRVYLSGVQALVRLPIMQRQRDEAAGLNTAGFISGYRGSPLGGYDVNLWRAQRFLARNHIRFQPGVNEDLAATAVWGSQQVNMFDDAKYDGVVAIWYGKGPGVDRSGDALKHGSLAGSSRHGGVLCLAGDDHSCKSSTLPHQSEQAFVHYMIPVLHPATVDEYLSLGLLGIAMSRFSGCWVAFKAISESVETSASVLLDPLAESIIIPAFELPEDGLNIRNNDDRFAQEKRHIDVRLPAAQAFAYANHIDRIAPSTADAKLGIAAPGKAYLDVCEALSLLGLDQAAAAAIGIRVYKIGLSWPLEPRRALEFATGLEEIMVVEEKRGFVEEQLKSVLFNYLMDGNHSMSGAGRGVARRIVGKHDENGKPLLPSHYVINPSIVARAIVERLRPFTDVREFEARVVAAERADASAADNAGPLARSAFFCSGCPHNTSTKVPEGSMALAGIGCHAIAKSIPGRNTQLITHMGAEGANWTGRAPFTELKHVFQNLGDGTYFHSGALAIRQAVASGANITYKILFNDAVAMTGGQPFDGQLTPDMIARQVAAEGAVRVVVVTDEPGKYRSSTQWPQGTQIHHRDALDQVQRELREVPGCSVLIYDQTCAAQKRRRRKRGTFPDPDKRAFINELVCEGCGDCSVASNCISVQPLETGFGRKRRIDQSNCNKDFSCIKGFCPSFVTVHGATLRKAQTRSAYEQSASHAQPAANAQSAEELLRHIPEPPLPVIDGSYGVLVTGIGGTGVVTIGALLGMAAHLEGKAVTVMDDTGMAQKNGAVASHIRIALETKVLHSSRLPTGRADLLLGCDLVESTSKNTLARCAPNRTHAVVNSKLVPTAAFVVDWNVDLDAQRMVEQIEAVTGGHASFVNASEWAAALSGNSIAANPFLMGHAWQQGLIPLSRDAIRRAIELNAVAVEVNLEAFEWGRAAAHDAQAVAAVIRPLLDQADEAAPVEQTLDETVAKRVAYLTDYQDAAYAARYRRLVNQVKVAEGAAVGSDALTQAVARNFFKLMAYKDEYEVARLYTDGRFKANLERQFAGDYSLTFHMAPPLLAKHDPQTGQLRKKEYGPWMLQALRLIARFKGLRGGALDLFGKTAERRMERQLIADYAGLMQRLLSALQPANHGIAIELAQLPESIRGFGHVKLACAEAAKARQVKLLQQFEDPQQAMAALHQEAAQ
ncbi:MAG: indolepyruvate ferredoxin oxidoreductase family protein [Gammaproteobacteria bacterium]|nr:indolepyruvate ferredoxin oxidoreductase family protein [Gammaproteobacteria bacterium]